MRDIKFVQILEIGTFKVLFEFIDVRQFLFIHRYSEERLDIFQVSFFLSKQPIQDLRELIGKDRSYMLVSDVLRD